LGEAKEALLAKDRAVRSAMGAAWYPLRDAVEKRVLDAATHAAPDFVDPEAARWDYRTAPGLYLRLRLADAKDVKTLRKAAESSQRDGFVGCFLHEPNPEGVRDVPDGGAFAEQPWNWQKAYASTRILSDEWADAVKDSDDPLRLRVFEQQYDRALKDEIPLAIDLVKRAQFFLFVLDDDSPDAQSAEAGVPVTDVDLQGVAHDATVHLVDLRSQKEVVRLKRSAVASFVFAGERPVTDPETLDAMKRQVNNCALAREIDRAIAAAASK
jgi:hypothetical protein